MTKTQRKADRRREAKAALPLVQAAPRLETVIDPFVYKAFEAVIAQAIQTTNNEQRFREALINFSVQMRNRAVAKFGFVTADSEALSALLRATDPKKRDGRPRGELDIMEYLDGILDPNHAEAAHAVQDIWTAFSTFLSVSARDYEPKSRALKATSPQPLDVMSEDTWEAYKEWFKPWLSAATRRRVDRRFNRGTVQHSEIVHRILVQEEFPATVDSCYNLRAGAALTVLQQEMSFLAFGPAMPATEGMIRVYVAPPEPEPLAA